MKFRVEILFLYKIPLPLLDTCTDGDGELDGNPGRKDKKAAKNLRS